MINQTTIQGLVNETNVYLPSQINPKYLSDKFYIGNTNEQKILFALYYIGIGVSYNVTIDLQTNSSTGVSFSIFSDSGQGIEGVKTFILEPNETRTEIYVSHWDSDGIPIRKGLFQLVDETKNASGSYQVQKIHGGYYVDIGPTGATYIANITEWLYSVSLTSSNISTTVFSSIEWIVGAILCTLYLRGKRNRG